MSSRRVIVVGGGAAGFFGAITCAEASPACRVTVLEKSAEFLGKVRISGGGRCNVTHALFEPRAFATRYPRGEQALIGCLRRFQAADTVRWFEERGVRLKTEADGRMFPVTDSSETIVQCLLQSARRRGVELHSNREVNSIVRGGDNAFTLMLADGTRLEADAVLLATGGCRSAAQGRLAVSLGHTLVPPVPSLFTFQVTEPWLRELAGVSVAAAELSVPETRLRERGPLLVTHWGLSGPCVLRLSAWGARELHDLSYRFVLRVNWLPEWDETSLHERLARLRSQHPAKRVGNISPPELPARLWEKLARAADMPETTRWSDLSRAGTHRLVQQLRRTEFQVTGKSLNKDEFVTCGGVRLAEIHFKTMASRLCPSLYFAGELLDVDGITGGFNFQAAWTTGWIAGRSLAGLATG